MHPPLAGPCQVHSSGRRGQRRDQPRENYETGGEPRPDPRNSGEWQQAIHPHLIHEELGPRGRRPITTLNTAPIKAQGSKAGLGRPGSHPCMPLKGFGTTTRPGRASAPNSEETQGSHGAHPRPGRPAWTY